MQLCYSVDIISLEFYFCHNVLNDSYTDYIIVHQNTFLKLVMLLQQKQIMFEQARKLHSIDASSKLRLTDPPTN